MEYSSINMLAREERHAKINLQESTYHQQKTQNRKSVKRFFSRICALSATLLLSYMTSYQLASAFPDTSTAEDFAPVQFKTDQVYILQDNGFVMKPSAQTEKSDRSGFSKIIRYTVEPGDSLSSIASKFSLSTQTIIANNPGISSWTLLKVGRELKILPVDGLAYTIQKDDTLQKIAKTYSVKEEDILRQNKISTKNVIANTEIILPGAKPLHEEAPIKVSKGKGGKFSINYKLSNYNGPVSGNYIWPCNGKITQYYHKGHYAIDIGNRNKGPIYATASGVVVKASNGWNGGYGNIVVIDHGNGMMSLYAHNEKLFVKVGDKVSQGQTVSWMGNSGRVRGTTGIHLHFELIQNGAKKNPLAYIGMK